MRYAPPRSSHVTRGYSPDRRILFGAGMFGLLGIALVLRLFQLQVLDASIYRALASDQHSLQAKLIPERGTIFVRDRVSGELWPIAKDRDEWQAYAVRRELGSATTTAHVLADLLQLPEEGLVFRLSSPTSSYAVLAENIPSETATAIRTAGLSGIGTQKIAKRWYPEQGMGGQILGFVAEDDHRQRVGRYGIEGYFQTTLAGEPGSILGEKDAAGRRLTIGDAHMQEAVDGSDVVLTIDRTIQHEACAKIAEAVQSFQASGGSVVIMDPQTGAIRAMCSAPDFDPAHFGNIRSVEVLNNPSTFYQYEPGSIFKPFTIAAGLDAKKITTYTTYEDKGYETMDGFTVRNSDKEAHGIQTMTQVLEKSLNTGTIFVQRLLGADLFREYVQRFGFGEKTGIRLHSEAAGDVSSLERKGKIFGATASYGQGISVTPLQIVQGYAALGNGGKLVRPYIVDEIIHSNGAREKTSPTILRDVISPQTSRLISAMLVSVVEHGHGHRAGVPGYYVAGKTGTAQIPDPNGKGYLQDVTIGSFAGYAPADKPVFVMIVKIDKPRTVQFAESSAAPVFGDLAKFLLTYYQVSPER